LKNGKKNKTCNKLGYKKVKCSTGTKISWKEYAAFIRNRKEQKPIYSQRVTII